ncbi:MAG: hypothetical protein KDD11_02725 [Acidobacteria bacterium]|nr:hypothetical protein [Acidobacteriota bacterium]
MALAPEYLLCIECETPCYTFEWEEGQVVEALCLTCGNDDPAGFLSQEELDALASAD